MVSAFIEGMMLGFGAAIPLGPINVLIMTNALRSYPSAVALGAGAMSADTTYLVMIVFGAFHFFKDPAVMNTVSIIGVFLLLYFAWMIWRGRNNPIHETHTARTSIVKNYIKGYSLTLLNPYTLIFWFSVSAYIATKQEDAIYMLLGLFTAITIWITLMPLLIHKTKHLISQKIATVFSIVSAAILMFFAIGMVWRVIGGVI
jgi:L-lysine exporter family protein LysE/ArgO